MKSIRFTTDEKVAETSSKGNQEKWREGGRWYKLDQFGYEALAEAAISNIAVLEQGGVYDYCPIFDNGAGLLSNTQLSPMDIAPNALLSGLTARPFHTSFTRQRNTAQRLYGAQLKIPPFSRKQIEEILAPLLPYYAQRDRALILDRVWAVIAARQRR